MEIMPIEALDLLLVLGRVICCSRWILVIWSCLFLFV